MKITLIAIGKSLPSWVNTGIEEFSKRISAFCNFNLIEIPMVKRSKKSEIAKLIVEEGKKLLAAVPKNNYLIALDEHGDCWNSVQLSKQIENWQLQSPNLSLLIGGPDGLAAECLQQANSTWSLSPLTFPHTLARVITVEQLFRGLSILHHHPYHRI